MDRFRQGRELTAAELNSLSRDAARKGLAGASQGLCSNGFELVPAASRRVPAARARQSPRPLQVRAVRVPDGDGAVYVDVFVPAALGSLLFYNDIAPSAFELLEGQARDGDWVRLGSVAEDEEWTADAYAASAGTWSAALCSDEDGAVAVACGTGATVAQLHLGTVFGGAFGDADFGGDRSVEHGPDGLQLHGWDDPDTEPLTLEDLDGVLFVVRGDEDGIPAVRYADLSGLKDALDDIAGDAAASAASAAVDAYAAGHPYPCQRLLDLETAVGALQSAMQGMGTLLTEARSQISDLVSRVSALENQT